MLELNKNSLTGTGKSSARKPKSWSRASFCPALKPRVPGSGERLESIILQGRFPRSCIPPLAVQRNACQRKCSGPSLMLSPVTTVPSLFTS